jgi:hypothetical protein
MLRESNSSTHRVPASHSRFMRQRMSAQVLNETTFSEGSLAKTRQIDHSGVMTLSGTVAKSLLLLGITLAGGVIG